MRKQQAQIFLKKAAAIVSSAAMMFSLCPAAVLAAEGDEATSSDKYILMNIPYADFYENELNNDIPVDSVTSATTSKWNSGNSSFGVASVYYEASESGSGGTIKGISYPVKISDEDLEKLAGYEVTDTESTNLATSDDYYYTVLESDPTVYKEVTVESGDEGVSCSFSEVSGEEATEISDATVTLATSSNYGDYQVSVSGIDSIEGNICGVIVQCTDGTSYGLRGLENIWRGGESLSWSCGIKTTESHGNTLSYAHYESMMGKTISGLEYITDSGVYTISLSDDAQLYVARKFGDYTLTVDDATVESKETSITMSGFPEDFSAEYSVAEGFTVSDGKITWESALPGSYTLTVSDANGIYAEVTTTFTLSTTEVVAAYSSEEVALVKATDATEESFENYISNITAVSVNGTSYSAAGKRSVTIIKSDGSIDTTATSNDTAIFGSDGEYEIIVTSTGYADLAFTLTISSSSDNDSDSGSTDQGSSDNSQAGSASTDKATNETNSSVKVGTTKTVSKAVYTVTGTGTVEYKSPSSKKVTKVTIPSSIKIDGVSYKVTSIAKNAFKGCKKLKKVVIPATVTKIGKKAFSGCKNLKKITIKSTKLTAKSIGAKAFKGINAKATIKVPKSKVKAYKKILKTKGIGKKVKVK